RGYKVTGVQTCALPIYDPLGLYVGKINLIGNTSHTFHDGLGRVTKKVLDLRAGGVGGGAILGAIATRDEWDGNSRLVRQFDANEIGRASCREGVGSVSV